MELFVCELVYATPDYRSRILGVFSTWDKADTAGKDALQQNTVDFSEFLVKPCTLDTPM